MGLYAGYEIRNVKETEWLVMRGVSKRENGNFRASYTIKGTQFRKTFKSESEAIQQRLDWESELGNNSRAKDFSGQKFGSVTIIGDTGKRDDFNNQIVIARNDNGDILEAAIGQIKQGNVTGLRKHQKGNPDIKKYAKQGAQMRWNKK